MKPSDIAILVVDDETSIRDALTQWLSLDGYCTESAADANGALLKFQERRWDIVLLDIKMPGIDGLELQRRIRKIDSSVITIMITAFASVETSIQALKEGAYDYIVKPVDPDDMSNLIKNAVEQRRLQSENSQLRQHIEEISFPDEIVGESPEMRRILEEVTRVSRTDSTVILKGESGSGKELIARAIHGQSSRKYFPLVTINCSAYQEGMLESELFGHEKGAFPGALYKRQGRLEMAHKGTIFLDEICRISPRMQGDILRMLETHEFTRLGGDRVIPADFRVICSTSDDLEKAVQEGRFSEPLYYRLNVVSINIQPLRERRLDIPAIARFFIGKFSKTMQSSVSDISPEALDMLLDYYWPGNVRELKNVIERAMVVTKGGVIDLGDLSFFFPRQQEEADVVPQSLSDLEKEHIQKVLDLTGGNIAQAAAILKVSRLTIYNKIEKYGLRTH